MIAMCIYPVLGIGRLTSFGSNSFAKKSLKDRVVIAFYACVLLPIAVGSAIGVVLLVFNNYEKRAKMVVSKIQKRLEKKHDVILGNELGRLLYDDTYPMKIDEVETYVNSEGVVSLLYSPFRPDLIDSDEKDGKVMCETCDTRGFHVLAKKGLEQCIDCCRLQALKDRVKIFEENAKHKEMMQSMKIEERKKLREQKRKEKEEMKQNIQRIQDAIDNKYKVGDYHGTLVAIDEMMEVIPKGRHPPFDVFKAKCFFHLKEFAQAEFHGTKALTRIETVDAFWFTCKGMVGQSKLEQAARLCKKGLKKHSKNKELEQLLKFIEVELWAIKKAKEIHIDEYITNAKVQLNGLLTALRLIIFGDPAKKRLSKKRRATLAEQQLLVHQHEALGEAATKVQKVVRGKAGRKKAGEKKEIKMIRDRSRKISDAHIQMKRPRLKRRTILEHMEVQAQLIQIGGLPDISAPLIKISQEDEHKVDEDEGNGEKKKSLEVLRVKKLKNVVRQTDINNVALEFRKREDNRYDTIVLTATDLWLDKMEPFGSVRIPGAAMRRFADREEIVKFPLTIGSVPTGAYVVFSFTLLSAAEGRYTRKVLGAILPLQKRFKTLLRKRPFEVRRQEETFKAYAVTEFDVRDETQTKPYKKVSDVHETVNKILFSKSRDVHQMQMRQNEFQKLFADLEVTGIDPVVAFQGFSLRRKKSTSLDMAQSSGQQRKLLSWHDFRKKIIPKLATTYYPNLAEKQAIAKYCRNNLIEKLPCFESFRQKSRLIQEQKAMNATIGIDTTNIFERRKYQRAAKIIQRNFRIWWKTVRKKQLDAAIKIQRWLKQFNIRAKWHSTTKRLVQELKAVIIIQRTWRSFLAWRQADFVRAEAAVLALCHTSNPQKRDTVVQDESELRKIAMKIAEEQALSKFVDDFAFGVEDLFDDDDDDEAEDKDHDIEEGKLLAKFSNLDDQNEASKRSAFFKSLVTNNKGDPVEALKEFQRYVDDKYKTMLSFKDVSKDICEIIAKIKRKRMEKENAKRGKINWRETDNIIEFTGMLWDFYCLWSIALDQTPVKAWIKQLGSNFVFAFETALEIPQFRLTMSCPIDYTGTYLGATGNASNISNTSTSNTTGGVYNTTSWSNISNVSNTSNSTGSPLITSQRCSLFPIYYWFCLALALVYPFASYYGILCIQKDTLGLVVIDGKKRPADFWTPMGLYIFFMETIDAYFMMGMTLTFISSFACDYTDPSNIYMYVDPRVKCFSDPMHFIYMGGSALSLLLFYPMASLLSPQFQFYNHALDVKFNPTYLIMESQTNLILSTLAVVYRWSESGLPIVLPLLIVSVVQSIIYRFFSPLLNEGIDSIMTTIHLVLAVTAITGILHNFKVSEIISLTVFIILILLVLLRAATIYIYKRMHPNNKVADVESTRSVRRVPDSVENTDRNKEAKPK
eukprot:g2501.t1